MAPANLTQKLIRSHLVDGEPVVGEPIGIRIDQTITHDVQGQVVMLELLAMELSRVATECSVQYVDHQLLQVDHKNPDDHRFLQTAAQRLGFWFSRAGNGISHPVHQERFGIPGKTLLGSDSHTPAGGALGMFAMGAGATDVAMATSGEPYYLEMPEVWGIRLTGSLPDWVSAKDVILELLRRHGVAGGRNRILEYHGDGLHQLSAMDRHVIANMGTELGAVTSVFPSDERTRAFLTAQGRADDWTPLGPDEDAVYDVTEEVDLATLEPLIAMPSSPGNVVPVGEVAGIPIGQSYIGSSANPGYRDFAVVAAILGDRRVHDDVSLDLNPGTRQVLETLLRDGHLLTLVHAGGRLHQPGCNGCAGMGQAPATDTYSLRTVPRNFAGRSGTDEDKVCLVSPETAAASALRGEITDPRMLPMPYPMLREPGDPVRNDAMLHAPLPREQAARTVVVRGPNIVPLPEPTPLPAALSGPVLLQVGDDISTDEILPAGQSVLPFRSNIPRISEFVFHKYDPTYVRRALDAPEGGHCIVAGHNYGQGSSREHAAIAPRYLGLHMVIAKSFARIHLRNLINWGVLPLEFIDSDDYEAIRPDDVLQVTDLHAFLSHDATTEPLRVRNATQGLSFAAMVRATARQRAMLRQGGALRHAALKHPA